MARGALLSKLARDDPVSIWMCLDGWSATTTSYIGAEICELLSLNDIKFRFLKSPVYISNWRRVKLVLGCLVMEERHTGEKMADFVEALCETWRIRSKVDWNTGVFFVMNIFNEQCIKYIYLPIYHGNIATSSCMAWSLILRATCLWWQDV